MFRFLFFLIFPALLPAQKEDYVVHYEQYTISNGLSHNHVYQSYKDSRGILWLITARGLNRFDGNQFKFIPQVEITDTPRAKIFLEDKDGEIWIGGSGQPLLCLNIHTEQVRTAREKFGKQFPEQVLSVVKGISDTYLIQTSVDSIQRFTPGKGVEPAYHAPGKKITPIIETSKSTLWMETSHKSYGSEMIAINPAWTTPRVFKSIAGHINGSGVWGDDMVYCVTQDSFLVVGEKGIYSRSPIRMLFPDNNTEDIPAINWFQQIAIDRETGQVWCFTPLGVRVFNKGIQLLYELKQEVKPLLTTHIYDVHIDTQLRAWLSTMDGLFKVRCSPNPFRLLPAGKTNWQMTRLYQVAAERNGNAGFQPVEAAVYKFPGVEVRHVCKDTDGSVWIATSKGLIHIDWMIGLYRIYRVRDGLSHNSCHAVLPDEFGFLWISSDDGLMQLEKRSGRIKTYHKTDGLGMDKFFPASCYRESNGALHFGGTHGVVSFYPAVFMYRFEEQEDVRLTLTECRVYSGKTRQEEDVRVDFFRDGKIEVRPNDHFIQMHFAVTDYLYSGRIDYEYKIEGYQDAWRSMDKNVLSLAGLPYGDYKVLVKAKTANGVYAGQALTIPLRILRPVYLQPGFVLLFVIVLLGFFQGYKKYKNILVKGLPWSNTSPVAEDPVVREEEQVLPLLQKPEDVAFLERLQAIVLEHLDKPKFNAEMLSKLVGLSVTQLHRRLTALTGLSTGRYIYSIRLQEAKQRIEQTNLTISEIAYQTGFSDPAYFTRLFTKMFQYPPSHFR
jgi:AraC-like DNA-binding protein